MVTKGMLAHGKCGTDEVLKREVLIERSKRLRALNRKPDAIGLTLYTWRSFAISKKRER